MTLSVPLPDREATAVLPHPRPPARVRQAHAVSLTHAWVGGGAAAVVLLFVLASLAEGTTTNGKGVADAAGVIGALLGAVALAAATGYAARQLRRGSNRARIVLLVLESALVLAGLGLGAATLRFGLAGGGGVWLLVLVPAAVAVAALGSAETRRWCAPPTPPRR